MAKARWDRVADADRFQSMVGHLLLALGNPASVRGHAAWAGKDGGYDAWVDDLAKVLGGAGVLDLAPPELQLSVGPVMVQATVQKTKLVGKITGDIEKARKQGCRTLAVFLHHQCDGKVLGQLQKLGQESGKTPVLVVPFPPETIDALLHKAPWVRQRFLGEAALSPFAPLADGVELRGTDFALPFVGRDDALTTLDTALRTLVAGEGGVLVVSGPSGVGKTRLLVEWARQADASWAGHALLQCVDTRGPLHMMEDQAIAREKLPVVVVETEPSTDEFRFGSMIQPLLDALRSQRVRLAVVIVIRSSQVPLYRNRLAQQKMWSDKRHIEVGPWPDDVVKKLLADRVYGPREPSLRHFVAGLPGLATLVARTILRNASMSDDDTWSAIGSIARVDAQAALSAHGLELPKEPFFLEALALVTPVWTPAAHQRFAHEGLQAMFSIAAPRLEAILEVLAAAGLLRKSYTYDFAPEELGQQILEETLAGPRGNELLGTLEERGWLQDSQVLENLAFAVPSPEHPSARPLVDWFAKQTRPESTFSLPSAELLSALAGAVPKAALAYAWRLLEWFPARPPAPRLRVRGRERLSIFEPHDAISGAQLVPLLTAVVSADSDLIGGAMRVLADPRRGPERYSNHRPCEALERWLDPYHTTTERVFGALGEAESWLAEASLTVGQRTVIDALVRALMRRVVATTYADGVRLVFQHQTVPASVAWLQARDRAVRLVACALEHDDPLVRHLAVSLHYDLGETYGTRVDLSPEVESDTAKHVESLLQTLAQRVQGGVETDFGVLAEVQRVVFWRWTAREGSELQAQILRSIPRPFRFRLFVTALDWEAIADFGEVEGRFGPLEPGERWRAWVYARREHMDRWGDALAHEIVRLHPTPASFLELAQALESHGLGEARNRSADRREPLWLWKLARLHFPYLESLRLSEVFEALPDWLRRAVDDQWLQVSTRGLESIEADIAQRGPASLSLDEADRALAALAYRGITLGADRTLELVRRLLAHPEEQVRALVAEVFFDRLVFWIGQDDSDDAAPPNRALVTSVFCALIADEPSSGIRRRATQWLVDATQYSTEYRERLVEHVERQQLGEALARRFAESGHLGDQEMRALEWCAAGDVERWLDWLELSDRLTAVRFFVDHIRFGAAIRTVADFERVVERAARWRATERISESSRHAWLLQVGAQVPELARAWVESAIDGDGARRVLVAEVLSGLTERGEDVEDLWARLIEHEEVAPLDAVNALFHWSFGEVRNIRSRADEVPPIFLRRRESLDALRQRLSRHTHAQRLIDAACVALDREVEGWRRRRAER
ncbi:MAG TPA: ATP-binding protein [Myxococcota bacterium]|nr:ATP-binding protein [Myxococcota bacterium]